MPQRKVPLRELIHFIVQVRHHSTQEGDEKRQLMLIRNLANRMYRSYIGYNYRGECCIKGKDEPAFGDSVAARKAYEARWAEPPEGGLPPVEVEFLGHSAVRIRGSRTVLIDPWITGNRACPIRLASVRSAHAVLVTHEHAHHLGDAFEIARKTRARLVGITGLVGAADARGIAFEPMNVGGRLPLDGLTVHMVPALHATRSLPAAGYVVEIDGIAIYHAGDTALFDGMGRLADEFKVEAACLPIGDRFGMGPAAAAAATRLIRPRYVIPIHYGTLPEIEQDAEEFRILVSGAAEVRVLAPGESLALGRGAAGAPAP
jgi:L-ascorbate metabolism protein UlaG (beta-lactamase superfamily)